MKAKKSGAARSGRKQADKLAGDALIEGLKIAARHTKGEVALPGYRLTVAGRLPHRRAISQRTRQAFQDEADEAWHDYEQTGLHVTQAEVRAWAKSLGTSRPRQAPKAHVSKGSRKHRT
jgi:hypothetical protein